MAIDASLIGKKTKPYTVEVEKGHIRRFAEAIGDESPLYIDEEFAKQTVYKGIIAPPTFPTTFTMGRPTPLTEACGFELRRVLHGEQSYIHHLPVRPGETYTVQTEVTDVYEKEGRMGKMTFIVLETEARNILNEPVVTGIATIVYRQSI